MNTFAWNKRAVAGIAVAALVGALSPISASAWDNDAGPDEIVTVTVDLGENPEDGGGGGGNVCTGFGSLSIPLTNISVAKERKILKVSWAGDNVDDDNNPDTPSASDKNLDASAGVVRDDRDLTRQPIDPVVENTRTNYVSSEFVVRFDADNCEVSERSGYVWTERQPVERYYTGQIQDGLYWQPVEMTDEDGILGADALRATANLFVDYSLFGVNKNNVRMYEPIEWEVREDNYVIGEWGTKYPDFDMPVIWGTSGEANMKASLTIFGDVPVGKYRVKHGFTLDTDNYNSGPWFCYIGFCP
jgi:hypothetical protein